MTISVVLRIPPAAVAAGRFAAEAEIVATGERTVVRSAEELIAFLSRPGVSRVVAAGEKPVNERGGER